MSYQNAQRVPAWKRLGLKLKGPASAESPAPASPANATPTTSAPTPQTPSSANAGVKRKQPPSATAPIRRAPEKRQRTDAVSSSPKKTVKFTEDTKAPEDKPTAEPKKAPKKPKEKKQKSKPAAQPAEPFNLEPSLAYLRQWDTDRESWKFNKNHQTLLIKHFFDTGRIPASDVPTFLAYIRDLKGFVRTRLREEAAAIKKKDMADGAAGFAQVKEKADKESKLELYEEVLSKLLQLGQPDGESSATNPDGNGKRSFDEAEFTAEEMDVDVKQRVVKRMRAELVLQELSESEESTTSAATTTTTSSSATETAEKAEPAADKGAKLNDGTQPLKRRRLRKSRTADISDDSSSESESDSDSDSDSSSDSSDDEEDEEMPLANGEGAESSSSSSSSESESDSDDSSDSDSESGAGAKVEEDGDGSSSDSDDSG
jgi:hypothetical protein